MGTKGRDDRLNRLVAEKALGWYRIASGQYATDMEDRPRVNDFRPMDRIADAWEIVLYNREQSRGRWVKFYDALRAVVMEDCGLTDTMSDGAIWRRVEPRHICMAGLLAADALTDEAKRIASESR